MTIIQSLASIDIQGIIAAALLVLGTFTALVGALYALFLKIPGDQPDKILKLVYDFTVKFSKKPE